MSAEEPKTKNKIDAKELLVKYKQLAEEYNKVVRDSQILKKAILLEHEKSANVATSTRDKDIRLKSLEEENEVLKYNNDRLTKRVMVLQESVNTQKEQSSKWFSWGSDETLKQKEEMKLFMEELERKTLENETLHNEVSAVKQEQQQVVELLQTKIGVLKKDLECEKEEYEKKDSEKEQSMVILKREKELFTQEISELGRRLNKLQEEINNKTDQLHQNEIKFTQNIMAYTNIIQRQISFDDTRNSFFNSYNLPTFNKNIESYQQELKSEATHMFIEVTNCFSNEYLSYQDRIIQMAKAKELTPQLIQAHKKVGEFLSLFPKQLIPLHTAFQNRFGPNATETSNKFIFESATNFIIYHQKLISWIQLSVKEESLQEDTDNSTQHLNESLNELYGELHESIYRVLTCFYSPSTEPREDNEKLLSTKEILNSLKEGIIQIVGCRKGISLLIHSKLLTEHNDAFLLPRLRAANEKFEICLEKTNQSLVQLQKIFENSYDNIIVKPVSAPVRGIKPPVNAENTYLNILSKQASRAIQKVNLMPELSMPQYIPFNTHQEKIKQLQDIKIENEKINHQLDIFSKENEVNKNEKLKAQQEIVKFKEENSLKQARINTLLGELIEKRKLIENMGNGNQNEENKNKNNSSESQEKPIKEGHAWELTVIDPNGTESNSLPFSEEFYEKELKLEKFYAEKFSAFNNILKLSDSRVVEMFQQQEKLEKQITSLRTEKEDLNKNLQSAFMQHSMSVDDHDTTKVNYDQQLNVLSEHVVQLTQKISTTEEELELIKSYKVRCGRCKTWNTVGWLLIEGKNGQYCSRGNHPSSFNFA